MDDTLRIDGKYCLVEARWTKKLVEPKEVRDFVGKVTNGKLDYTLGIMVSVNGFTDATSEAARSAGRLVAIFVDGRDLYTVLEGHHDLKNLLERKMRHAANTGEAMYRIGS